LLVMKQMGAAIAILAPLTADPDPAVAHDALAVLANARIMAGDLPGGLQLLLRATEGDAALPPARRGSARADLGLALLMCERETEGLDSLHQAQVIFEQEANCGELAQCLLNESAFLERAGRQDEAKTVRERAHRVTLGQ
jgi:hypothetical protein